MKAIELSFNTSAVLDPKTISVTKKKKDPYLRIPFYTVIQTSDLNIEKHLVEKYEKYLYVRDTGTLEDSIEIKAMRAYIVNNIGKSEIKDIKTLIKERNYFGNLDYEIEIKDGRGRYWTDPEMPYIQIDGFIVINMDKMWPWTLKNRYYKYVINKKWIKFEVLFKQYKSFPLPLEKTNIKLIIERNFLYNIDEDLNNKNSLLYKQLKKKTGIKKFFKVKRRVYFFKNYIKLDFFDTINIIIRKTMDNKIKALILAIIAMNVAKQYNQKS